MTILLKIILSILLFAQTIYSKENNQFGEVFEKFWKESKKNIYPKESEKIFFTKEAYKQLKFQSSKAKNLNELASIINKFLNTLEISHTRFYTNDSVDFYMLRSLFTTKDINTPKINHIGAQFTQTPKGYIIREVLQGYPAELSGLRRGDIILQANKEKFHPYNSFNFNINGKKSKKIILKISRNNKIKYISLAPINQNPHKSFLNAMLNSKKIYQKNGKKFGYIHLWTGTNNAILKSFKKIITTDFINMDGIILDLRGGFGGAWYDYLDPFFENRNSFFNFTWINREGKKTINSPEKAKIHKHYSGPMIVLINQGVRSGKEALAYQFKKSKRAILIGETTQGSFTAGKGIFTKKDQNYFLYLASAELLLDGQKIEGIGVSPNIHIPQPINKSLPNDPQLEKALFQIQQLK